MKKCLTIFSMLAGTLIFSGCATMFSESRYPVSIESEPSGANFTIKNRRGQVVAQGVTPQVVNLKSGYRYFRRERYTVNFSTDQTGDFEPSMYLDGNESDGFLGVISGTQTTEEIRAKVDPWYWMNALNVIGIFCIDPNTGAMYKLPSTCRSELIGGNSR